MIFGPSWKRLGFLGRLVPELMGWICHIRERCRPRSVARSGRFVEAIAELQLEHSAHA